MSWSNRDRDWKKKIHFLSDVSWPSPSPSKYLKLYSLFIHGQTGWFTVVENEQTVNNTQDGRFCCESHPVYGKKKQRRHGTSIQDGCEEIEHEYPLGSFRQQKYVTTFTDVSLQLKVSHWNEPKRAPLILQIWKVVNHHHVSLSLAYVFCG